MQAFDRFVIRVSFSKRFSRGVFAGLGLGACEGVWVWFCGGFAGVTTVRVTYRSAGSVVVSRERGDGGFGEVEPESLILAQNERWRRA